MRFDFIFCCGVRCFFRSMGTSDKVVRSNKFIDRSREKSFSAHEQALLAEQRIFTETFPVLSLHHGHRKTSGCIASTIFSDNGRNGGWRRWPINGATCIRHVNRDELCYVHAAKKQTNCMIRQRTCFAECLTALCVEWWPPH